ncbi:MAG: polysaccharide biosynthesis/export family protein, partial [Bacteroidota bacterium]
KILVFILLATIISSCNYNSSVVFKLPNKYEFASDSSYNVTNYKIAPFDKLSVRVLVNNGSRLLDLSAGVSNVEVSGTGGGTGGVAGSIMDELKVDSDGGVRLPLVGNVCVGGFTIDQAEKLIEDKYSKYYVDPFVVVKVTNRRVIIFSGNGGAAQVVTLVNEKTTLIEALAMSGGIDSKGKSKSIRLVRKSGTDYKIYHVDLSKPEGVSSGQMIVEANDLIYIDQVKGITRNISADFSTVVGLIVSILLLFDLANKNF